MQIVHSAELDEDGVALDANSYYAKFMAQLRADWDIVDEGPMTDLLGIDCDKQPRRFGPPSPRKIHSQDAIQLRARWAGA